MENVIKPDLIIKSFQASGMIDPRTGGYDLEKIIQNYKVKLSPEETLDLVEKIPRLANIIGEKGELTEGDMDKVGIERTSNKDGHDITRRRYVTITNPAVLQELREKAVLREIRGKKRSTPAPTASSSSS
jgi:hypothetical protein